MKLKTYIFWIARHEHTPFEQTRLSVASQSKLELHVRLIVFAGASRNNFF